MRSTRLVVVILIVVWLLLLASVGWVFLHPPASVRNLEYDSVPPDLISYREALDSAKKTVFTTHTSEQWAQANKVLVAALANPLFARLRKEEQGGVYSGAGWAAMRLDQDARARNLLAQAVILDPDDPENWRWLARNQSDLHDYNAAAKTLVTYARRWPDELDENKDFIFKVVNGSDAGSAARLELLQALFSAKWNPEPLGASGMWKELALSKIRLGQREAARLLIKQITAPDDLVGVRSDKRFDGLFDPSDPRFNVEAAARRQADLLRSHALSNPNDLKAEAELGRALLVLGLYAEVLDRSDRTLVKITYGDGPFKNLADQKSRIMNNRARALAGMGRFQESVAQLEQSAKPDGKGEADVNQVLNLGAFYCSMGRADDALSAAGRADDMSDYGKVVQAYVQHCAAVLKHDGALAKRALAFMREHRKDNEGPYLPALLRDNHMDEAAKSVIDRLAAEDTRNDMLAGLQDYLEAKTVPGDEAVGMRWDALIARDDVRRAVENVGRIQHYDYYGE